MININNLFEVCIIDYFPQKWLKENNIFEIKKILRHDKNLNKNLKTPLGHGIAIVGIINSIVKNLNFCVASIDDKTNYLDIINLLYELITNRIARVINISFGFFFENNLEAINLFQMIINLSHEYNVLIVCSESNKNNEKVYPAMCKNVISVGSCKDCVQDILIYNGKFLFKEINMFVDWIDRRKIIVKGNSFYNAIASGIIIKENYIFDNMFVKKIFKYSKVLNDVKYFY